MTSTQTYLIKKISELRTFIIEKRTDLDLELVKKDLAKYELQLKELVKNS